MNGFRILGWGVLTLSFVMGPLSAQKPVPTPDPLLEAVQESGLNTTSVPLTRLETPPQVDGVLDDDIWKKALRIDGFRQVVPIEGAAPSEKTEFQMAYDSENLYIAVRCFEDDPDKIIATQMLRDGDLGSDDRISFVLDTFHDRRNAFYFQMNAVGARGDGLVENSGRVNRDYDLIWYGKAEIGPDGWVAEIRIPFKSISFDPSGTEWGFNIERFIRRFNETDRWASPRQNVRLQSMAEAGVIEGIRDIEQGLGLDIKPFVSLKFTHDRVNDRDVFNPEPGLDVFYKITPQLTAALTINTDFAETEVDARRVNLTRFPLFFPEKRDFFLQDAGIFDFGGIRRNPLPFFSRRIGIGPGGVPVDILAGVKVTGRVGRLNVGLLDVQVDSSGDVDGKNLAVGRFALNVLDESQVGIITTVGDPRSNESNALGGADFRYRNSHVFGDQIIEAIGWAQRSFTPDSEDGEWAYGARLNYPNDAWRAGLGFSVIEGSFNPALGFVSRRGIRELFANARYRYRFDEGSFIRRIDSGFRGFLVTDLGYDVETANLEFEIFQIEDQQGDELTFNYIINAERLTEPFEISDGVTIGQGHYRFDRWQVEFETSSGWVVGGNAAVEWGDFFDGTRLDVSAALEFRPSSHFFFSLQWERNAIDLPAGSFHTDIGRARINIFFTPDISWNNFIQYDNVSDQVGINSRFRWIIEPGREVFFVVNQGFEVTRSRFESTSTAVTVKVGWTFRF
ncbi:MAG TPA: hypothetical protein ENK43_13560 [Planctomycetes bacterium]|nr:hypothetical protein [Planctomycetota bacterium]